MLRAARADRARRGRRPARVGHCGGTPSRDRMPDGMRRSDRVSVRTGPMSADRRAAHRRTMSSPWRRAATPAALRQAAPSPPSHTSISVYDSIGGDREASAVVDRTAGGSGGIGARIRRNRRTARRPRPTAIRRRPTTRRSDRPAGRLDACGFDHTAGRSDMSDGTTPPETIARLLRRRAEAGTLWIDTIGNSMGRAIPDGARVRVVAAARPRRGEVWAMCSDDGRVIVHRALGVVDGRWWLQGDANRSPDRPVGLDRLIGRVDEIDVAGRRRRLGAFTTIDRSRRGSTSRRRGSGFGASRFGHGSAGAHTARDQHAPWSNCSPRRVDEWRHRDEICTHRHRFEWQLISTSTSRSPLQCVERRGGQMTPRRKEHAMQYERPAVESRVSVEGGAWQGQWSARGRRPRLDELNPPATNANEGDRLEATALVASGLQSPIAIAARFARFAEPDRLLAGSAAATGRRAGAGDPVRGTVGVSTSSDRARTCRRPGDRRGSSGSMPAKAATPASPSALPIDCACATSAHDQPAPRWSGTTVSRSTHSVSTGARVTAKAPASLDGSPGHSATTM